MEKNRLLKRCRVSSNCCAYIFLCSEFTVSTVVINNNAKFDVFLGYTKTIWNPGCSPVHVSVNGCRGYCLSWTIPASQPRKVSSFALCCRMVEQETVSTPDILFAYDLV
ncbi:DAN domain containing protein [Trichuris trichiura]|uniref:DAN domain containing protein n=1 Tax=Trichuris trichiura TaxID=36087 RepID=A0A077YXH4_TRITR|nr:DAN domain containing protein [Trichuris trichiura]